MRLRCEFAAIDIHTSIRGCQFDTARKDYSINVAFQGMTEINIRKERLQSYAHNLSRRASFSTRGANSLAIISPRAMHACTSVAARADDVQTLGGSSTASR
eukprot:6180013-Pleurochrysis_carterae.AAC.3